MHRLSQTWQRAREYSMSYVAIPVAFALVTILIRLKTTERTAAMSEIVSWVEWTLIPAALGFIVVFAWHYFRGSFLRVTASVREIKT